MNKKGYGCLFPILAIFLFVAGSAVWYHVNIWVAKREKIDAIADMAAAKYGVDPRLVKAIIWKESRYRVNAVGKAGEIGLMQVYGTAVNEWSNRTGKPGRSCSIQRPTSTLAHGILPGLAAIGLLTNRPCCCRFQNTTQAMAMSPSTGGLHPPVMK